MEPITERQVTDVLRGMGDSAAGMDKIEVKDLLLWHQFLLAGYRNLVLAVEELPEILRTASGSEIDIPTHPGDFRPISITSAITRVFHKIMARRLCNNLKFSPLQYAFLEKDGCLEASALLHAIIRRTHDNTVLLSLAFLDLAKAFHTIAHDAILEAAGAGGIPRPFLSYLKHLYANSTVFLSGITSRCGRRVRQGDPLSPILFILVMDRVVRAAVPDIGVEFCGNKVYALAYTDDLLQSFGMFRKQDKKPSCLEEALVRHGMALNIKKSASLTITKDGKRKCLVLVAKELVTANGVIAPMGVVSIQKYLGLTFTWKGKVNPKHTGRLNDMLNEVSTAPLISFQRLEILRTFLLPKLTHELVVGNAIGTPSGG